MGDTNGILSKATSQSTASTTVDTTIISYVLPIACDCVV